MAAHKPAFPPFEDWTRMSEEQQDALPSRIEVSRRRRSRILWIATLTGFATAGYVGLAILL